MPSQTHKPLTPGRTRIHLYAFGFLAAGLLLAGAGFFFTIGQNFTVPLFDWAR